MSKPFLAWLAAQAGRTDPIGDVAADMRDDPPPARIVTPAQFRDWVRCRHLDVAPECLQAIMEAGQEWSGQRPALSLALRFTVFRRDGYACQICGRTAQDGVKLEVDHKQPRAKGGSDDEHNLWTLCFDCNRGKRDRSL